MMELAELQAVFETDEQILRELAKRGDDPTRIHLVEHHFLAPVESTLRSLGEVGQRLGFALADVGEGSDGRYSGNLVSRTALSASSAHRESLLMEFLAQLHGADYDGWGTHVEK